MINIIKSYAKDDGAKSFEYDGSEKVQFLLNIKEGFEDGYFYNYFFQFLKFFQEELNKKNSVFTVEDYQIFLKYVLHESIKFMNFHSKYENDTRSLIYAIYKSKCIRNIISKLLYSFNKDNTTGNALDTVTSIIKKYIEQLLSLDTDDKQKLKKYLNKKYIALEAFDIKDLLALRTSDLRDYLDLPDIEIPINNKEKYSIVEQLIGETQLKNLRLYMYKSIYDKLNDSELFKKKITELIKKNENITFYNEQFPFITLNNMKHIPKVVLTVIANELYKQLKESVFDKLEKTIWCNGELCKFPFKHHIL